MLIINFSEVMAFDQPWIVFYKLCNQSFEKCTIFINMKIACCIVLTPCRSWKTFQLIIDCYRANGCRNAPWNQSFILVITNQTSNSVPLILMCSFADAVVMGCLFFFFSPLLCHLECCRGIVKVKNLGARALIMQERCTSTARDKHC